ncbi:GntR family transcriptional regulator [Bombiscardovia apis]|uniref:GntR family transcriptional regulator n=1 Tax=Bombiscardovia apis TaxID=2932182 RepID=A0ABM8BET5_9BIFI|nr:GntR family transcriptional regulator [Bombiscardovia apis]BDR55314.1 GntR family transcriptional regulator [Bombiscardovia apis]
MVGGIPKYVTVGNRLRSRLRGMAVGEQLPSEAELCEEYKVSRITLRRAIDDIIREGQVVRSQGKGTFKAENTAAAREVINSQIKGFYRQQVDQGRQVRTRVVASEVVHDPLIARMLGIDPSFGIVRLERLRYVNEHLQQHVVTFLSLERFPEVLQQDFSDGSLYEFLQKEYGVRLERDEVVVRVETVEGKVSRYFEVEAGTPVLAMDSTVYDSDNRVICYGEALHPPNHSEIKFVINNPTVRVEETAQ